MFGLFALVSAWVLALDLWQVVVRGRPWTGIDGVFVVDQMQYLAWVRDASRHVLVSNLFVVGPTPADYLQPLIAISGGLVVVGLVPWLALAVWQPVAVVAVLFTARAFVHRLVPERTGRRVAVALVLFGGATATYAELWLGFWTWGYPFGLIALSAMLGAVLAYERARTRPGLPWGAALLALLASWLHPWQGEILIVTMLGAEAVMFTRSRPRATPLLCVLTAAALPLVYYAVLDRADPSWKLGQQAGVGTYPLPELALVLAPLALPAALAYRVRPTSLTAAAVRVWPPAALLVFLLAEQGLGSGPMHAFLGIAVPLGVLTVQGIQTITRPGFVSRRVARLLAAFAVAALTVPITAHELAHARWLVDPHPTNAIFPVDGNQDALEYLARDRHPGAVLADWYLGIAVPGETGRSTYVGDVNWSQPDFKRRAAMAAELMRAQLPPQRARAFVLSTRARFVLADCVAQRNLLPLLGTITAAVHRFGCASIYVIKRQGTTPPLTLTHRADLAFSSPSG